jgi:outer membrane biosynthesis protein TonB
MKNQMNLKSTLQALIALAVLFATHPTFTETRCSIPHAIHPEITQAATPSLPTNADAGANDQSKPDNSAYAAPQIISTVKPGFPEEAKRTHGVNANVIVTLYVEIDGKPSGVRVIRTIYFDRQGNTSTQSGSSDLTKALEKSAVDAVNRYKFKPARRKDGTPVRAQVNLAVNYQVFQPSTLH